MSFDLERRAKDAFIDESFELAVDLYTQAISLSPTQADLYADRAQVNIKLLNFPEAVADAQRAIELDANMQKAYYRKGIACMKLEEYQTAKATLEAGAALAPAESKFVKLIQECEEKIAEEMNDTPKPSKAPSNADTAELAKPGDEVITQAPAFAPSRPKYRHEFYQKSDEVVVTVFAKGVPASYVSADFGEQILSVSINVPGEEPYHFQPRLFGKIIPDKCKFSVLSTKVEIHLAKAEPVHWMSLEYSQGTVVVRGADAASVARPTYPSSKPKGVDWDKLEAEVKKEEKEEKLDGDAGLNKFFRGIYADADEDTRRAMSKSFVESNGTVLSTNWKKVGARKVEGGAPDGMELKKWEY